MSLPPNTDDYTYVRARLPKHFTDSASPDLIAELARKPVSVGSDAEQQKVVGNVRRIEGNDAVIELDTDQLKLWKVRSTFAGQVARVAVIVRAAIGQALRPMRVLGLRLFENLSETASAEEETLQFQPPAPQPVSIRVVGGEVKPVTRSAAAANPALLNVDRELLDRL